MRLINFCRLLGLVLCGNAVTVYFVSHSFRLAVVTTLSCSLLLQLGYFASVLFLIWRSSCAGKAGQGAGLFDRSQEVRYQSRDDDEGEVLNLLETQGGVHPLPRNQKPMPVGAGISKEAPHDDESTRIDAHPPIPFRPD
ncbi:MULTISPECIES: exopolysaccharide production repressor protein [Mesorhizobium]|uniref:Exopolysaccharide repressor protein n=1 Tax=Rhizobium loti TaxID=381 RepID=M5AN41_RHILI|nr:MULTISPECIES: exopolysaccharide production repressor protein [Mesorhizobium]BAN09945.1 conserved hypothetical protein [Mesorhizobium loti NZP2037]